MGDAAPLAAGAAGSCDDARPSIFAAVKAGKAKYGDSETMVKCYLEDTKRFAYLNTRIPEVVSLPPGMDRSIRVLSWNINTLTGADKHLPRPTPRTVANVVLGLNPDVVVLQEAGRDPSIYADVCWQVHCDRVRDLTDILKEVGFDICSTKCGNPFLVAVAARHTISKATPFNLDNGHEWKHLVSTAPGELYRDKNNNKLKINESRTANYVQVKLGGEVDIRFYATHLHHNNYTRDNNGARAAEMRELLKHQGVDGAALVVGDMNQQRQKDYSPDEWAIIQSRVKGDRAEDDGVDTLLQAMGFRACWDLPAQRNFPGAGTHDPNAGAPPMTHWTGTTVDYVYFQSKMAGVHPLGVYVYFTKESDHLPIVVDIGFDGCACA